MSTSTSSLEVQTRAALPAEIGRSIIEFKIKCQNSVRDQIELANEGRRIGLLVQEWTGRTQINFSFYQTHKSELPGQVTFEMMQSMVSLSHRLQEPAASLNEVKRAIQQSFQSFGLMEIPERTQPQTRKLTTFYVELVTEVGKVRDVLVRWDRAEPFQSWDEQTRAAVRGQIAPLVELYNKL